jgi:demethylmenaquinone methyltransferase/2-methoxy-6-polyprenyl-1,4-benzoquinol methylase
MTQHTGAHREQPAWNAETLRDPHAQPDKAKRVAAMFDAIAPTYERVNAVTSFGRDAAWRRRAVAAANVQPGDVVLDVCCGTGDMVRAFANGAVMPRMIVGVDFAGQMLAAGDFRTEACPAYALRGDALRLPLADASVNVISCVFGVRNFHDVGRGLGEMARVARAGGRVVILEFSTPANRLLRSAYRLYCERVLPWVAGVISRERQGAYRYLARSIRTFDPPEAMVRGLERAGLADITVRRMNLGGVALYRAVKPG